MIEIEQLNSINIAEITALALQLWPDNEFAELQQDFAELMRSGSHYVCAAVVKEQYIGFIHMSLRSDYVEGSQSSPVGYIEGIYVMEQYRQQGISRKLVETGEAWAAAHGCSELASDTELGNVLSQQVHQKLGFREAAKIVAFIKPIGE